MIVRNGVVRSAMGALLMLGLGSCMIAQQHPAGRRVGTASGGGDHGPQPDPNMPNTSSPVDLDVSWIYTTLTDDPARPLNVSIVWSRSTPATNAVYLGWTSEEGSWIANPAEKGRIYTWKNKVLTPTNYKNLEEIPEATARRFRNLQVPYLVSRFEEKSAAVDQRPAPDPNMPYPQSPYGDWDVQWHYETAEPTRAFVGFSGAHAIHGGAAVYLGWTPEEGSWLVNPQERGRIYFWKNFVLTPTDYKNTDEIPEATVRRLRNLQEPYLIARFDKPTVPATKLTEENQRRDPDPNMPRPKSSPDLEVQWTYSGNDPAIPTSVRFIGAHATHSGVVYLGWTPEEGSWIENPADRGGDRIYTWKNNVLTPTNYRSPKEIPEGTVRRLRNLQPSVVKRFEKSAPVPSSAPDRQQATPAPQANANGGAFADLPKALQSAMQQARTPPPGQIAGTGAKVQDGVLTFARADNTKASYRVVRPAVMQNAPQGSGVTGAWVTMEDNGMGILFTVQPDGSVSGREMPAQIIEGLMQVAR